MKKTIKQQLLMFLIAESKKSEFPVIPIHKIHRAVDYCVSTSRRLRELRQADKLVYRYIKKTNAYEILSNIKKLERSLREEL